jgi:F-type H+-transporting ATPase subunit b
MTRRHFAIRGGAVLLGLGLCLAPAVLAQEKEAEKKEEKKSAMPEPSIGWQWANFVVLAGLVVYMARKAGAPFFNARAAEIRKGIDEAEKIKAESNAKIAAINSKLGRLDAEIASLRETASGERRAAEQRIKAETQQQLDRINSHCQSEIETAGKAERIALQRYAAQLAMSLAEGKVRARKSANTDDALIQAFINGLGAPTRPQTHN